MKRFYKLGQKVEDKFITLSKIGLFTECFTAAFFCDFLQKNPQNWAFRWMTAY